MRTIAIAKHDFVGQSETELSFKAGARIVVTNEREPGDWWKGEIDGKRGFFPSSFCEVCEEDVAPANPACTLALAASTADVSKISLRDQSYKEELAHQGPATSVVSDPTGQAPVSQEQHSHAPMIATGDSASGPLMSIPSGGQTFVSSDSLLLPASSPYATRDSPLLGLRRPDCHLHRPARPA